MKSNTNDNFFDDLKNLGFDNLDNMSIYKEDDIIEPEISSKKKEIENHLFDRKLKCPVCDSHITVRAVKSSSIRTQSKDTDFMIYYGDPNPMFYGAWVCVKCGYAGLSSHFSTISPKQKEWIKEKISSKWTPKEYPQEYTVDISIERYKLALLSAIVKNLKSSNKALICLKIAWHYRLKEDISNENNFLKQSLQGLLKAFEKESFPIAKMDEATVSYLIGELYRRLNDNQNAIIWFGRVLGNRNAKTRIKDMARDQKYLMMDEKKEKQTVDVSSQVSNTGKATKKGFLTKLFG